MAFICRRSQHGWAIEARAGKPGVPRMRRLIGRSPHAPAVAREIEDMVRDVLTVRPRRRP